MRRNQLIGPALALLLAAACGGGGGAPTAAAPAAPPRPAASTPPAPPAPAAAGTTPAVACSLSQADAGTLLGRAVGAPAGVAQPGNDAYPDARVDRTERCAYPLAGVGTAHDGITTAGLNVQVILAADAGAATTLWTPVRGSVTGIATYHARAVAGIGDEALYFDTAGQAGSLSGLLVRRSRVILSLTAIAANPAPGADAYGTAARQLLGRAA